MEIQALKSHLTILEVAERLQITVDRNGKALCPFHDDKTPSLQFSKEKNIATCFSSNCDAGTMDIIGLCEKKMKLSTHEAIMKLKAWAGHNPGNGQQKPQQSQTPDTQPGSKEDLSRIALLTKVFRYFENGLRTGKTAKEYLQARNLVQSGPNQQGIEVGYNAGSFYQRENKYLIESALKYGLVKKTGSGHSAFSKGCIVFPLKNKDNQVIGMYFRETDDNKPNHHYYLQDRQGLYPGYPHKTTTKLILTESIIDAATLLQIPGITKGYTVLACYGTNGLTEEYQQAIKALESLTEIILFFDGDEAGQQGVKKNTETLRSIRKDVKVSYVETPQGEDVNSLSISHEKEIFTHLLDNRKEVPFSFSIESSDEKEKSPEQQETLQKHRAPQNQPGKFNADNPYKITYFTDTGYYYVKGGLRQELDSLRVSLVIENTHKTASYHKYRNKVDLYENKQVERIAREAAEKLDLRADLVELDLHRLTDLLEDHRDSQVNGSQATKPKVILDNITIGKCREFLTRPNLIQGFNELIGKAGVVGEQANRVFLFCIASSYKMPDTLHALIQGSTGSGKTHLLTKISNLIPDEDAKRFTRVTDSSFYNYGMYDLQNKLICLEDLDGMKEEAQLAFRELQSREVLSTSTTGQDEKGNIRAYEKVVYGPIASLACTTRGDIYEDNMSRCFLIAVDETKEQTQRVIKYQNKKASGKIDGKEERKITDFVKNCIRMLKSYEVVNPYADKVQLPEEAHKIRRLNDLYQGFVKQVTLINQYRRQKDSRGRLITDKEDLGTAAEIMFDSIVLKVDELDGSLRLFYENLKDYITAQGEAYKTYSFGQREVRQALHVSKSQLQRYITDLLSLEYIHQSGGYVNRGYRYKVVYWDDVVKLKGKIKRHLQGQLDQLELYTSKQITLAAH